MAEKENALPGGMNEDSYVHIDDDAPCFADEHSYDNNNTVEETASKRTQVEESLAAEDSDEEYGEPIITAASTALLSRALLLTKP